MAEIAQTFSIDPYAAERSKIARQQKFAELLQSQALQPNEKFSYAGIEAPISAAGGLAKALQAGMSGYLQGDAARKEDAANIKQEADYNAANEAFIRGMTSTPGDPGTRGTSPATKEDVASRALSIEQGSTAPPLTLGEPVDVLGGWGALGTEGTPGTAAVPGSYTRALTELSGLTGNPYAGRLLQQLMMRKLEQDTAAKLAAEERDAQFTNDVRLKQTQGAEPTSADMQAYLYDVKNNGFKGSFAAWTQSKSATKAPTHVTLAGGVFNVLPSGKLGERLGDAPSSAATALTEGERKAGMLYGRLLNSQAQLAAALDESPDAAIPGVFESGVSSISPILGNTVTSAQRQRVEAAQLDILEAALTLSTGAAYTPMQLEIQRKSHFPQIGDDPPTIKDKAERLNTLVKLAEIAAGRAAASVPKPPPAPPSKPSNVSSDIWNSMTLKEKIEFKAEGP